MKQLSPDPFEHRKNYELNKVYKVKVVKIMDFGVPELELGLTTFYTQGIIDKNISAKKCLRLETKLTV